jgi:hypothetical protein
MNVRENMKNWKTELPPIGYVRIVKKVPESPVFRGCKVLGEWMHPEVMSALHPNLDRENIEYGAGSHWYEVYSPAHEAINPAILFTSHSELGIIG